MATKKGQPSLSIEGEKVKAWVTEKGGHIAPVSFLAGDTWVEPLHVAPWAESPEPGLPPIIEVLRGDFFCCPFGGNASPYGQEQHPIHGETANKQWRVVNSQPSRLTMEMDLRVRPGKATKEVWVNPGEAALYQRHVITGQGPMSFGHHAMLSFPEGVTGRISVSSIARGQVFPLEFENPAQGGYTSLKPGALFDRLEEVPLAAGGFADLSVYPAREGYEDLVQVFADPGEPLAWTACVFSSGYLWLSLKNSRQLTGTVMWHSNGGRHYAPWSGRHRRVIGLEEVTSWFHAGLSESIAPNDAQASGFSTYRQLPLEAATLMACAAVPPQFDILRRVEAREGGVEAVSSSGEVVFIPLDLAPLNLGQEAAPGPSHP